jgi:hypothetical protein
MERHLPLLAAALRANLPMYRGAAPTRTPDFTDLARHLTVQFSMVRTHVFFKVEIEHDDKENPEKIGEEIANRLRKLYAVRSVELSSIVTQPQ